MVKHTALSKLTTLVPVVKESSTVSEVEKLLQTSNDFKSASNIFVVNETGNYKGSFRIEELFKHDKSELVNSFLNSTKPLTVPPDMELHRVALRAISHDVTTLAVVDVNNKFQGAITSGEIIKILDNKSVENILRHGGISISHKPDIFNTSVVTSLKHRLPWLLVGLLGGIATAGIVNSFEKTLEENIILAMFIPLIVYMADAVGNQMEAFIIRDLNNNPKLNITRYAFKQLQVIGVIAIFLSTVIYAFSTLFFHQPRVSFVVATGLLSASLSSVITGIVIPYVFSRLKFDPADASGPIATIVQDFSSLLIYFTIAAVLL